MIYCCLLCSELFLLLFIMCLICLAARCRYVPCILGSKCFMAFSVSIISSFMNFFGSSIEKLGPYDSVCSCSLVNLVSVRLISLVLNIKEHIDPQLNKITSPRHACLQISSVGCSWKCLGGMQGTHLCLFEWLSSVCFIVN